MKSRLEFRFVESCSDEQPVDNMYQLMTHISGTALFVNSSMPPFQRGRWMRAPDPEEAYVGMLLD